MNISADKINEKIIEISGIDTEPFIRFSYKIPLDKLIELLMYSKNECQKKGYENLSLWISEDDGLVDMSIYGDRDLNEDEIQQRDEILVVGRIKSVSDNGLSRNDILEQNCNNIKNKI